jgi:site-specific recombinase XerD
MPVQTNKHPGIKRLESGKYQARARVSPDKELSKVFATIREAKDWQASVREARKKGETAGIVDHKMTMREWSEKWLQGMKAARPSTYSTAVTQVNRINEFLGDKRLVSVRPSDVREWVAHLKARGLADSTIYVNHGRLSGMMSDAVHDGLISKNPCSSRTAPKKGKQKAYVCSAEDVWKLYHALPGTFRNAVLLGAYAGLRIAEAVAVHPVRDVNWEHGTIRLQAQYGGGDLKTGTASNEIVVPLEILHMLRGPLVAWKDPQSLVLTQWGRPASAKRLSELVRDVVEQDGTFPEGFSFHDLRHFYASTLIAARLDIKTIQYQMRHDKASTTLDIYGHLMEGKKESARAAIAEAFTAHADFLRSPRIPPNGGPLGKPRNFGGEEGSSGA